MTKRRSPKRSTSRLRPRSKAGPLTLAEARRLAGVTAAPEDAGLSRVVAARGTTTKRRAARASGTPVLPSILAVELGRERLEAHRRKVAEQRVRDYTATMQILKDRGVLAPSRAGRRRAANVRSAADPTSADRVVTRPLQVFAEGDSWFDYPVPLFGGGIVPRLADRLGVPILDLASAGDEVRYMLGVEQRAELRQRLQVGCPAGGPWDVLLFSGGGNDIVGDPMTLWVRDYAPGKDADQLLHDGRFATALGLVRAGYEDLIALRDHISPATHLMFHTYDFAIPDGRGVCGKGPWLKPTFDARGYPRTSIRFEIVQLMLRRFGAMLASLARPGSVTVIDGQGLLPPGTGSWHNELHPSKRGYMAFADRFRDELRRLFPAQLP